MNDKYILILIIAIFGIAGITTFSFFRKNKKNKSMATDLPTEYVDDLSMATVIDFFKQPAILARLKANSSLVACAIKEKYGIRWKVTLTIFDSDKSEVDTNYGKIYVTDKLSPDLLKQFGDKDMIVLK